MTANRLPKRVVNFTICFYSELLFLPESRVPFVMKGKKGGSGSTTRRTLLQTAVGAGTAAGVGVGGVLLSTREKPALAASGMTADDVSIENDDGSVSELTINPEPTVEWSGLDESADRIFIEYLAGLSGEDRDVVGSRTDDSINGTSGSITFERLSDPYDILEQTSLSSSDFEAEDGTAKETDVDLDIYITLSNDSGGEIIGTNETVTFTVIVNNLESSVTVSGSFNTDGS